MNNVMRICSWLTLAAVATVVAACQATPGRDLCDELTCSGHGTCSLQQDAAGKLVPTCTCAAGYTRSGSQGWLCLPETDDGLCAGMLCSGHGACASFKGKPRCTCDTGYVVSADGKSCMDPCASVTCSGQGTCKVSGGAPACACNVGYRLSADGKACVAPTKGAVYTYKFTYDNYPTYQMGRGYLDLTDLPAGKLVEHQDWQLRFDYGGRGLRRLARQVWTVDTAGRQVLAATLDDRYTQGKVTRRRRFGVTFAKGVASITAQRLEKVSTHTVAYAGGGTPIPMLGGFEYPGWTLGSFSPAFYMLAGPRYDFAAGGVQTVRAYWPATGAVQPVKVVADAAATTAKPVLFFPEFAVRVSYGAKWIPQKIQLIGQGVHWERYDGMPADLNMPEIKAATPAKAATLPKDLAESSMAFTSADATPLGGTLALPTKQGKAPFPAVLMITDPWAGDRDHPHRSLMRSPLYRHLAVHLAQAGYASLRYDPRSRAGGTGRVRLTALVADAEAAHKALAGHSKIDPTRVYVISLGTSSVVAVSLLARGAAVKGYVGLAPVLDDVPQVMIYSATRMLEAAGFSNNFLASQASSTQLSLDQVRSGSYHQQTWQAMPVALWKDYLTFDGDELLATYPGPVLLLRGDQDMETPDTQLKAATAAAKAAGKKNLTVKTMPDRTFILSAGKMSTLWEEAFLPFEVPSEVRAEILGWLKKN